MAILCLAVLSTIGGARDASAAGVCGNTPGAGNNIRCEEPATSTSDIDIDAAGVDIDLVDGGLFDGGVYAVHMGNGKLEISVSGRTTGGTTTPSTIDTTGNFIGYSGVHGLHMGDGALNVTLQDTEISTRGRSSHGLYTQHQGNGDITVDLRSGVTIDTMGDVAVGVFLSQGNSDAAQKNDATLMASGISIVTEGMGADGIWVTREGGLGDARATVRDSTITTKGGEAHGVYGYKTTGRGDVMVYVYGSRITTEKSQSYGIYGRHQGDGGIVIDLGQGSSITTAGDYSHGVVAFHLGEADTRSIDIMLNGPVTVTGAGARGVSVGSLTGDGAPTAVAALDARGFRRQTVTVNGAITSSAEGVFLAGGGRVVIGPSGSIDSGSGIAILATGTVPEDDTDMTDVIPAIPPKLRVDLNLDGRRVAQVLNGGWIINDGGETTIAVNGVVLHDGATGAVGNAVAHNGAWDVTIRARGVRVTDRGTDPWTVSAPAANVIADRDFSGADFVEKARIIEEYAPRAALYEVLPDFLLGLDTAGRPGHHLFAPEAPVWVTLSGGTGHRDFDRSTVGAEYDTEYLVVNAGRTVLENGRWRARASAHLVSGSADVSSPVKGGELHAKGQGLSFDARWRDENDYYAAGRISWTDYELDVSSANVGRLVSSLNAERLAMHVEAGRRMALGESAHWTPHLRLDHTRIQVDRFTDAVGARVSFPDQDRSGANLGVTVDTVRGAWNGELSLRGSLNLKRRFDGVDTSSRVSGEVLRARIEENSVLAGLGAVWRQGPWALNAELSAERGAGSHAYSGALTVGLRF